MVLVWDVVDVVVVWVWVVAVALVDVELHCAPHITKQCSLATKGVDATMHLWRVDQKFEPMHWCGGTMAALHCYNVASCTTTLLSVQQQYISTAAGTQSSYSGN